MKRIGITQRVESVPNYGERRDCLDQAWVKLFNVLGFDLIPILNTHNDITQWVSRIGLDGLLLSGGNDLAHLPAANKPAPERDRCELKLLEWAVNSNMPVLGVCRGMQMMNYYLGGTIKKAHGHAAAGHIVESCKASNFFANYSVVNSFHEWVINSSDLPLSLMPLLRAEDGSIEAFKHVSLPWLGIMWHPERQNGRNYELDCELIGNHFSTPC